MRVGFTGTRKGMTNLQVRAFKVLILELRPIQFHHGDCIGADAEAHEFIRQLRQAIIIVGHPPLNPRYRANMVVDVSLPAKDYLPRNRDIVNQTDLLVATPGENKEILRSGTWSTIRYARRVGRAIYLITPDGNINHERP